MKKYGKLILIIGVLVVLILGARMLYDWLSGQYQSDASLQEIKLEQSVDRDVEKVQTDAGEKDAENEKTEENKALAPDFSMIDQFGQSKNLHGFIGKPIVLNFWASWCGPCKMELPDFQKAYEKYDGQVEFLMVNMTDGMRETKEKATEFMASEGYTLPVYFDALQSGAYTYSVYSLPTTYFIDAEGNIVARAEGMLDAASLEKGISMILQEKTKEQ